MQSIEQAPRPAVPSSPPGELTAIDVPGGPGVAVTGAAPQTAARVLTIQDIRALRVRREALSNQIASAASRRGRLAQEIRSADATSRPGLEARMRVLDERIVQIERDIAETGRLLASPEAGLVQTGAGLRMPAQMSTGGEMFGFGLMVGLSGAMALGWVRRRFRRKRAEPPVIEQAGQLARVEQAVEAIALEVERIAEGQRFTTRLMAEGAEFRRRDAVPAQARQDGF